MEVARRWAGDWEVHQTLLSLLLGFYLLLLTYSSACIVWIKEPGGMATALAASEVLPNIPGIRRHPILPKRVSQTYKIVQGIRHEDAGNKPPPELLPGEYDDRSVGERAP